MTQPNSKLGITLSIFGVVFAGLSAMAAVLALRTPEPTVIMIPQPAPQSPAEIENSLTSPGDDPADPPIEQAAAGGTHEEAAAAPDTEPEAGDVSGASMISMVNPASGATTARTALPSQPVVAEPEMRVTPAASAEPEELKVFETKSARVCEDRRSLRFTVRKNGTAAGDAIYLKQDGKTVLVSIGDSIQLSDNCRIVLQNTGKTSDYFAEFLLFMET